MNTEELKFPIGKFKKPEVITRDNIKTWIAEIESFPERLKNEVDHLTDEQLNTRYRPDGWIIRQVVHHCADSHMNSFTRFKLALTENNPTIKPYAEDLWAELVDSKFYPISSSLQILEGIHERWTHLLKNLSSDQLKRTFIHPSSNEIVSIDENIGIYAWHGNHHLAHITSLKQKMNWK
jgi:hypothetical protein